MISTIGSPWGTPVKLYDWEKVTYSREYIFNHNIGISALRRSNPRHNFLCVARLVL